MVEFGLMANMQIDEESNLDILDMFARTNEPTKEVVNKELLMFKRFEVDVKDIKCSFRVMGISTSLYFQLLHFLIVRFLACWFSNRN
jgi:hypothetical protein